jgi:hypothetical protein
MRWLLGLFVLLTAAPASAFEGEVEARSTGNERAGIVEFHIYVSKKGDMRMDTSAKQARGKANRASYIRPAQGKYDYAVDHARKQATKIPKDTFKQLPNVEESKAEKPPNVEVKKLGTDKVAGQSTRHVQVIDKDTGHKADLWLSDRYPAELWQTIFSFGGDESKRPTDAWMQVAKKEYGFKPGFIMKMVAKSKDGQGGGLEITRIQEKKVAADKFTVPSDYELATMPEIPTGLSGIKVPTTEEEAKKMREELLEKIKEMQEQQR